MTKSCASCGEAFEAKRATAKFCSNRCRQRAFQKAGPREPAAPPQEGTPPPSGPTALAVTAELDRAGRLDTALGQAAIVLAGRIDAGHAETGSGLAALVRECRATLAEALRDGEEAADPLDELRSRRERKLAGS